MHVDRDIQEPVTSSIEYYDNNKLPDENREAANGKFGTTMLSSGSSPVGGETLKLLERRIGLEMISLKAKSIFDDPVMPEVDLDGSVTTVDLDPNGQGDKSFLRVLLLLTMHDSPPLVSGARRLLFRHFLQSHEILQASKQDKLLFSDSHFESYK